MGQVRLVEQAGASTPAASSGTIFIDQSNSVMYWKDDSGLYHGSWSNAAIAAQGAGFSSDTWVTNSDLQIPSFTLQAKMSFLWMISASKSGAGTAQPVYTIRTGTNRSTSDTARLTLTGPAQTAVADIGVLSIMVTVRSVGSGTSAVLQGTPSWLHQGTATSSTGGTGFANNDGGLVETTGSGFDSTGLAGHYISLSINGGTSASWTLTQCQALAQC